MIVFLILFFMGTLHASEDTKDQEHRVSKRVQESVRSKVMVAAVSSEEDGDTGAESIIFEDLNEMLRLFDEIAQICGNA